MKRISFIFTLLLFTALGCGNNEEQYNFNNPSQQDNSKTTESGQSSFRSISPQTAKKMIDSRSDLVIIDVRTPAEMTQGRIAGSNLMPFWSVVRGEHNLPKDKAIILVCAVGGRSYAAGQVLARKGYREIYNLSGGIESWKRAGLPLKY